MSLSALQVAAAADPVQILLLEKIASTERCIQFYCQLIVLFGSSVKYIYFKRAYFILYILFYRGFVREFYNGSLYIIFAELPRFGEPLNNITVSVTREAIFTCIVESLGPYKVFYNFFFIFIKYNLFLISPDNIIISLMLERDREFIYYIVVVEMCTTKRHQGDKIKEGRWRGVKRSKTRMRFSTAGCAKDAH